MGPQPKKKVAVLQGNATVARLMGEFLEGSDSFEVQWLQGSPPGAARAQLVIVDIDSGQQAAEQWIHHCDGRQLPVIVCGVERSRGAYSDRRWLSRPFSPTQLRAACREALGLSQSQSDSLQAPPAIDVDDQQTEQPTAEIPEDDSTSAQNQQTATARQSPEELLEVLDIDGTGSMILEVDDVSSDRPVGGMLVSDVERRTVGDDELSGENPWAEEPDTQVDSTRNQPPKASATSDGSSPAAEPSTQAEVTAVSSISDIRSGELSGAHRVASLVAEHWNRIALTARPADRADRLRRILEAMLRDGMDGVVQVLERIPPVTGFSGHLETISVVELLHTIRDRGLRGRLEVGLSGHSFVLYIDETTVDGVESLGETTGQLFVDILRDIGGLDSSAYRRYRKLAEEMHGESLEMELRRDAAVDDQVLRTARKQRARRLLEKMCRGRRGTFAFIEADRRGGHSWPTQPLNLSVDELLLEVFRNETNDERGTSDSMMSADLVSDSKRAARLGPGALTEAEREALDFFDRGGSVDGARRSLAGGDEPVSQVVRRLERLELLRRLGEDKGEDDNADEGSTDDVKFPPVADDDPHERPTAVSSSWNLQILDDVNDDDASPRGDDRRADNAVEEETREDIGFSAGVPEEFDPRDSSDGQEQD